MIKGNSEGSSQHTEQPQHRSRGEVIRRLRDRFEPILMFGESVEESIERLKKLEEENSEKLVGLKNNFK